jgi:Ni/Fe-hydrogenase 1 B-type cytochrome subunit
MKYSGSFRVWHWLNALVIFGLLGTVFLRKTFLSYRVNSEILMTKLSEMGNDINIEDAKILAKAIRNPMWEWHIYLGYALVGLMLFRIYLFFKEGSKKELFKDLTTHQKMVKVIHTMFYVSLFFISISGLAIYFGKEVFDKELLSMIKESHEALFVFIMVFVLLHIGGVVVAEIKEKQNLISTMIHGKRIVENDNH